MTRGPSPLRGRVAWVGILCAVWAVARVGGVDPASPAGASPDPVEPRTLIVGQVPVAATTDAERLLEVAARARELPSGSRIVAIESGTAPARPRNLTPGFDTAGRPDVSFDGRQILFVGRLEPGDPFNAWIMDADGTHATQITQFRTDCAEAIHLSTIYTIDAERPERRIAVANRGEDGVVALYTCRLDGGELNRVTFTPRSAESPAALSDGRLLFSMLRAPSVPGRPAADSDLFTVNIDGTDLQAFAIGAAPRRRSTPCEIPRGDVVFVETPSGSNDGSARLVSVSRSLSRTTREVLTDASAGSYLTPSSLRDGRLLVAHLASAETTSKLVMFDPARPDQVRTVWDDPDWHELDARLLAPRSEPEGRSSSVDPRVDHGFLYALDARIDGPSVAPDLDGEPIERVRIYRHAPGSPTDPEAQALLGEAPVARDGSFYVKVPARTPLRLETLDAHGSTLRSMDSWIWVMPREVRGCIGCHEDPELTPPNRHVLALRGPPAEPTGSER